MTKRGTKVREYSNKLSIYEIVGREQPYTVWKNAEILRFFSDLKQAAVWARTYNGKAEEVDELC